MVFKPGQPKVGGRVKGTPNKQHASVRAAIIDAGEFVGAGAQITKRQIVPGEGGLKCYLAELAITRPELYVPLLARILPFELRTSGDAPVAMAVFTGDMTLNDAAQQYAHLLKTGGFAMSEEEQAELDAIIEDDEIKLLPPAQEPPVEMPLPPKFPKKPPPKPKTGKRK